MDSKSPKTGGAGYSELQELLLLFVGTYVPTSATVVEALKNNRKSQIGITSKIPTITTCSLHAADGGLILSSTVSLFAYNCVTGNSTGITTKQLGKPWTDMFFTSLHFRIPASLLF